MRYIVLFCLIASLAVFCACKKDTTPSLVGTWNIDRSYYSSTSSTGYRYDTVGGDGSKIIFNAEGTYAMTGAFGRGSASGGNGTYSVTGNTLILDGGSYELNNFSNNKVGIYTKRVTPGVGTYEGTLNLSR